MRRLSACVSESVSLALCENRAKASSFSSYMPESINAAATFDCCHFTQYVPLVRSSALEQKLAHYARQDKMTSIVD